MQYLDFACVYIYKCGKCRCSLMYSLTFMRFLIGRDADDFLMEEKEEQTFKKPVDNPIYRCVRYATVPVEIKHE